MDKLTALIVDDEEKALALLHKLLEDTGQFSIIRTAESASLARGALAAFQPDLIFLDIKMPEEDGFAFLDDLGKGGINAEIIFVTAYDQYALQAIRNHAFAYLLKPVNRDELRECISDFRKRKANPDTLERLAKLLETYGQTTKLRINTRAGYYFIDPNSILYCAADGNYTTISTGEKDHVCSMQLSKVQQMLISPHFVRMGRSLLINFSRVSSVDRKKNLLVFEKQGLEFPLNVSAMQLRELEKLKGGKAN